MRLVPAAHRLLLADAGADWCLQPDAGNTSGLQAGEATRLLTHRAIMDRLLGATTVTFVVERGRQAGDGASAPRSRSQSAAPVRTSQDPGDGEDGSTVRDGTDRDARYGTSTIIDIIQNNKKMPCV